MRKGIAVDVTPEDRVRLNAIIQDRNRPQKHVWRARIVLLRADGKGTVAIMRAVGQDKRAVWRWQERFMGEGVQGSPAQDPALAHCAVVGGDARPGDRPDQSSAAA